jgi:hypothetical protein
MAGDAQEKTTSTDGDSMSNVRHSLLLDAVIRLQVSADGEFLPVDGPVLTEAARK